MNQQIHEHRRRLAEWLLARHLDQALGDEQAAGAPVGHMIYPRRSVARSRPTAGDVYILRPASSRSEWGPVYVLIIKSSVGGRWLAAPFSRYPAPAVPGEMTTGMADAPLQVLCPWNVREIDPAILLDQPAMQAPGALVDEAGAVYQHLFHHAPQPNGLSDRTGPPISHPADPRYEYLEEERRRLDEHVGIGADSGANDKNIISLADYKNQRSEWLLAAEGRPGYGFNEDAK